MLRRWPEGGPKLLWTATGTGHGYATVAIADGRLYTAGNVERDTVITALDMAGKIVWQGKNGPAYRRSYPGARATPTVADGAVYHLNGDGDVIYLSAATGKSIWTVNILKRLNGRTSTWGLSESLLVTGGKVICCPGGTEVSMVALAKDTGEVVWTCTGIGDKPGYTAPILVECGGLRQILTMMSASVVGVTADTGRLLWRYEHPVAYDVNIVTPVYHVGSEQLVPVAEKPPGSDRLQSPHAASRLLDDSLR